MERTNVRRNQRKPVKELNRGCGGRKESLLVAGRVIRVAVVEGFGLDAMDQLSNKERMVRSVEVERRGA